MVPVVNFDQKPLMPTSWSRARGMIKSGQATPFIKKGIYCIRMNVKTEESVQPICIGIDPGSKKEGFTVKSASHAYINIQTNAITDVKDKIKRRREARRSRRNRKTPCRQPRWNRASLKKNRIPPSTKARWQWKLNIIKWLQKIFPVTDVVVEDIKAKTKPGGRQWNRSFSPLQAGKNWFYEEVRNTGVSLATRQGYETHSMRQELGLEKSKDKMSNSFDSHCVDSWVLANSVVGGDKVDNTRVIIIKQLRPYRRQLHKFQPAKGGVRIDFGGTISLGLKRGSLVRHPKYGVVYVGGTSKERLSLHRFSDGHRLCQNAKRSDCKFLAYNTRKVAIPPLAEPVDSIA